MHFSSYVINFYFILFSASRLIRKLQKLQCDLFLNGNSVLKCIANLQASFLLFSMVNFFLQMIACPLVAYLNHFLIGIRVPQVLVWLKLVTSVTICSYLCVILYVIAFVNKVLVQAPKRAPKGGIKRKGKNKDEGH